MVRYRIKHFQDCCLGCGNCSEVCPDNWTLEGGISRPLKTELDDDVGCNQHAAEECPESCIEIMEI